MSEKKRFIVISNHGASGCSHHEFDTLDEAEQEARTSAASGANANRALEYAIYEKVAITETQLVSVDVVPLAGQSARKEGEGQ